MQSLPRELHYHPLLKQLTFNPVAEQDQLRKQPALAELTTQQLAANSSLSLDKGKWPKGSASQSEVWVKFKMPNASTELGIKLMVCADADYDPNITDKGYDCRQPLLAYVQFTPPPNVTSASVRGAAAIIPAPWTVGVGVKPPPGPPPPPPPPGAPPCFNFHRNGTDCEFMAHTDIRSSPGDLPVSGGGHLNGSSGAEGNAKECQKMCEQSASCAAWVFFVHPYNICTGPPANRTCRPDKTSGAGACEFRPSNSACPRVGNKGQEIWAGAKLSALVKDGECGTRDGAAGGVPSAMQLLPSDEEIDIR